MIIKIPKLSLVILMGASGSGKSTFARQHFHPFETVSSDQCRAMVANDETDQSATPAAFDLLHFLIEKRLERGLLTVVDATNVQSAARRSLVELARKYHVLPVCIAFKTDPEICHARNLERLDRQFGPHVVRNQSRDLFQSLGRLRREGFKQVYVLESPEQVAEATIIREKLWNDMTSETGPFDIIGDVHGCIEELQDLLSKLGYQVSEDSVSAPEGRKAIFVGDLVDRGPASPQVIQLVMRMVEAGIAFAVPGNHDVKLVKKLKGSDVKIAHGLQKTLDQLKEFSEAEVKDMGMFLEGLVSHLVLDEGRLVVAHAGMRESMQGRGSPAVREFALYGETTGEIDEFGLPVRLRWAEDYRGQAMVVHGHTPVVQPEWLNNTVCVDTGCVFGGNLTALRYPEREFVSVPALREYAAPSRPLEVLTGLTAQQTADDLLDIADVRGRQHIRCEGMGTVVIPEENAAAALEVMSRFAADPRWLVYLPPTMSPSETSTLENFLEHPAEAFEYYRNRGVSEVICEEKHMGSRTVVIVGRDEAAILKRFGIKGALGRLLSRSGRPFFSDEPMERGLLERLSTAMEKSGFWERYSTDWAVLDCELMPWSAKAQQLIFSSYAPIGAAGSNMLPVATDWVRMTADRLLTPDLMELSAQWRVRQDACERYVRAYENYCWPVNSIEDYKLAPFHIMATEGSVHHDKPHSWHMSEIGLFCGKDLGVLKITPTLDVDTNSPESCSAAIDWWLEHTSTGGEGMVIKPMAFTLRGSKGMIQPAIKCRGQEYLRIIYGPEYLLTDNLNRLRKRGLARKRSLANREFSLGIEGLSRFVRGEPLRRVHQCAFGVLALESEPVDPRL